jgi:hypothetical protein
MQAAMQETWGILIVLPQDHWDMQAIGERVGGWWGSRAERSQAPGLA